MSLSNNNAGFCRLRSLERLGDRLTFLNPLTTPLKVLVGRLCPQLRTRRTLLDSWVWLGATEGGLGASCRQLGRGDGSVQMEMYMCM